jgi:hypothetical protein
MHSYSLYDTDLYSSICCLDSFEVSPGILHVIISWFSWPQSQFEYFTKVYLKLIGKVRWLVREEVKLKMIARENNFSVSKLSP